MNSLNLVYKLLFMQTSIKARVKGSGKPFLYKTNHINTKVFDRSIAANETYLLELNFPSYF